MYVFIVSRNSLRKNITVYGISEIPYIVVFITAVNCDDPVPHHLQYLMSSTNRSYVLFVVAA